MKFEREMGVYFWAIEVAVDNEGGIETHISVTMNNGRCGHLGQHGLARMLARKVVRDTRA